MIVISISAMGGVLVFALALCPPTRKKSSNNSDGHNVNKNGDLHIENEAFVYHDALKAIEHELRKSQMHGTDDNGEDEGRSEGVTNEDSNSKRKSNGVGARASRKGKSKRGKSPYRIRF